MRQAARWSQHLRRPMRVSFFLTRHILKHDNFMKLYHGLIIPVFPSYCKTKQGILGSVFVMILSCGVEFLTTQHRVFMLPARTLRGGQASACPSAGNPAGKRA